MAEGNAPDVFSKSRPVLGDFTNLLGKRGFSESEKSGVKSFNFNDKDVAKRICVSPKPCIKTNSLESDVVLVTSHIPNGNSEAKVLQFGCNEASKSSTEVETDCNYGHCLKGKNVVIGNSEVCVGDKDIKILILADKLLLPKLLRNWILIVTWWIVVVKLVLLLIMLCQM